MAHDHIHPHNSTYYLDQLCTVVACGALGGVAVMMYMDGRLQFILAPQFFLPVLLGGIALIVMVAIRAVTLWQEAGKITAAEHQHHEHAHDHGHEHHHEHAHDHGHEHHHEHAHDHGHEHHHEHAHDHGHEHHHDHSHEEHDHGWTPARYAVLMLPIALFFLNLPNSTFSAETIGKSFSSNGIEGTVSEVTAKSGLLELGFQELRNVANDPVARKEMTGKTGRLVGMYQPRNDKWFTVYRINMKCFAADAIPVGVEIFCKENTVRLKPGDWLEVDGQIQFAENKGKWSPMLFLNSADQVKPTSKRPNDNS